MTSRITVLAVDSHREDLEQAVQWLEEAGYTPIPAMDTDSALHYLYTYHPDVVVYAVDAEGPDGWAWLERIRKLCDIPLILVASRASRSSLERAFNLPVDGYLVKPLNSAELLGRLEAITRQTYSNSSGPTLIFRHDNLTVDWKRFEVGLDGRPVHLSPTEFKLLSLLVQRRGWVLTYDEILSHVWGPNYVGDRDYVKLYIWYLRRKIERDPAHPRWILTKRGIGYTFTDKSPTPRELTPLPHKKALSGFPIPAAQGVTEGRYGQRANV